MRITLPKFDSKKETFDFLKENKQTLIEQKKSMPIYSDCVNFGSTRIKDVATSKANKPVQGDIDTLRVKVVANTANWIDSHMDLLIPGSWNKTISERKGIIPHLHDHIHQIEAKVGEVQDIFSSNFSFAELGINGSGNTEALVFITDIIKSYNEKVFEQYKMGKVNQHSIGLQYMKLDLAINDESSVKEFEFWEKFYPQVINKNIADDKGFFWVVQEIKLIENSAVLFGANEITPTLDNNVDKNIEPINFTQQKEPLEDTQTKNTELRNKLLI